MMAIYDQNSMEIEMGASVQLHSCKINKKNPLLDYKIVMLMMNDFLFKCDYVTYD